MRIHLGAVGRSGAHSAPLSSLTEEHIGIDGFKLAKSFQMMPLFISATARTGTDIMNKRAVRWPTSAFVAATSVFVALPVIAQDANVIQLEPIIIGGGFDTTQTTAGPIQGYRALTAGSATKTDRSIEIIPQNIQAIPRTVIEDQASVSISEAVRNISNVQPLDSRVIGNVEQTPIKIRGFGAEQWVDGYAGNLFGAGDREGLVNVERIEVLKGPNAILYGGGAGSPLGGAINVISKLPTAQPSYEIGGRVGSDGFWNPFFDVNQPLNKKGAALFRLTGEYSHDDSFINVLEAKRYSINPTLTLTDKENTSLTLQGFISSNEQQAYPGLPVFGTILGDFRLDEKIYLGDQDIESSYTKQHGMTVTLEHEFNDIWSTDIKARWSQSEINQLAQAALWDATGTGGTPSFPPSTFDINNMEHFDRQQEFSINPTLQANFDFGPSRNSLLLGADYSRVTDQGFMTADTLGNMCFLMGGACLPVLVDLQNPSFPAFTRPVVGMGEGASFFEFDVNYLTKGIFAQLESSINDRAHILLGGRLGSLDITYDEQALPEPARFRTKETRFLPRTGVVIDVMDGLSTYASYSEGMRWAPFSQTFAEPRPELSRSLEAGFKFNLNESMIGTLAAFQIDRENVPYQISAGVGGLSEQRSRGFEADVIYQPNENWSILASYGYTDAKFSSPTPGVPAGTRVPMVPEHSGRFWVDYKFGPDFMSGWSAGAGIYAASSQTINAQQNWSTDSYFTIDAKLGYENERLRASLSIKNLTGEDYYTPYNWFGGQVAPGAPRAIYGEISYKF